MEDPMKEIEIKALRRLLVAEQDATYLARITSQIRQRAGHVRAASVAVTLAACIGFIWGVELVLHAFHLEGFVKTFDGHFTVAVIALAAGVLVVAWLFAES